MDSTFIFLSAIGGDGDVVEQVMPVWQKAIPYLCFAYTLIALWIGSTRAMLPYCEGGKRIGWLLFIFLVPLIGALAALMVFRPEKYQSVPTLSEQKEASQKEEVRVQEEKKFRDQEAMESFKPFED